MPIRYTSRAKRPAYRKRRYAKKPMVKKAIKQAKKTMFNKRVLQVIKRDTETKHATPIIVDQLYIEGYTATATTSTILDLSLVFSNITQGTTQTSRAGNRIEPSNVVFKGFLNYLVPSVENCPNEQFLLKMVVFRMKRGYSENPNMSKFLQLGASAFAPINQLTDVIRQINKDEIVVYAVRTFKLGPSSNNGSPGSSSANNDYPLTRFFNINLTKHCKNVIYNDTDVPCMNKQFYVGFMGGAYDGSTNSTPSGAFPVAISYSVECAYKDG